MTAARGLPTRYVLLPFVVFLWALLVSQAHAFTVNVVDQNGNPVSGFKWLLEEDNTHAVVPGEHRPVSADDVTQNSLALSIHKSHAPVKASGESTANSAEINGVVYPAGTGCSTVGGTCVALAPGRYAVSVLPFGNRGTGGVTYDMGGANIDTRPTIPDPSNPAQTIANPAFSNTVTVRVRTLPFETAQISVKVFHDIRPLNNAPDPLEPGLPGFTVTLSEQAGDIIVDCFGNKLGTTYLFTDSNGNGRHDRGEPFVLDADGNPTVDQEGAGDFVTDANGEVTIKYLCPGKYGVQVEPPANDPGWLQVTTIEGTKTIDAWVRPNEPPFLIEFGPPFWHVFYGFVKEMNHIPPSNVKTTVTGQVRKGHLTRPPQIQNLAGSPPGTSRCLVGLNTLNAGQSQAIWVGRCDDAGNFTIPDVPPGSYQIVAWDEFLDQIISFNTLLISAATGPTLNVGALAVPMWFAEHDHYVFFDANKNGIRDPGEPGIQDMNINLRFRDGSIYQSFPTDVNGFMPFEEIFPFFRWQVAEVDFARFRATGVTVVTDDGGAVSTDAAGEGKRTPQLQVLEADGVNVNPDARYRTEVGPAPILAAYQIFAGQNTRFEWGKASYDGDVNNPPYDCWPCAEDIDANNDGIYRNNGGISGIVFYSTTRAESDPRMATGDPWESGIPRVQVNLFRDGRKNGLAGYQDTPAPFGDGTPDDLNGNGQFDPPDVDNYPLGWADGAPKGPEDIDWNGNGVFDQGDALRIAWTDSWDDRLPTGCRGNPGTVDPLVIHGTTVPLSQCSEGLRTWNQTRPGVYDGAYAFGPEDPLLVPGTYVVEAVVPPGYKYQKEEDRNVDFGPTVTPALLPPVCVGDMRQVPQLFSFLTDQNGNPLPGVDPNNPDNWAPFAGETRRLCNLKQITVSTGQNSAGDFHMFTDVPKAARMVGIITDDIATELAPNKPSFTEKFSPGWLPISVRDYTDTEIIRFYADEFGQYNALVPSTYHINPPIPSGVGPKMHRFCLNDPGQGATLDPYYRPQYSTTCYQFDFQPAKTTYLDTPVIRQAAFVGPLQQTLDCEQPAGTPVISSVMGNLGPAAISGNGAVFTITSVGTMQVPNPNYPGDANNDGIPDDPPTQPQFVTRDFGFGSTEGTVRVVKPNGTYTFPAANVTWNNTTITVTVPAGAVGAGANQLATGQLVVTKPGGGGSTLTGVTLTVGAPAATIRRVGAGQPYATIQAAIDAASTGDLILVDPGEYRELVIMNKQVRLQGAGAQSTIIDARHFSSGGVNPLENWRTKISQLVAATQLGLVGNQATLDPLFADAEGPGILVSPPALFTTATDLNSRARIDGFGIRLADLGGAIYVNTNARNLMISNNRLMNNAGSFGGGIRIGNPTSQGLVLGSVAPNGSPNTGISVHHNHILQNGSLRNGGGISILEGATGYQVTDNHICGNLCRTGGGGIGHLGLSDDGLIARNRILLNEVFQGNQVTGGGGGIEIAGALNPAGGLTRGAGDVTVNRNLIQGNLAGALDGGGIALNFVNGLDAQPGGVATYRVNVYNNLIVNNVTGLAGGGISLQDTIQAFIIHNTIAHNDSVATSAAAFQNGTTNPSTPQPAGIVSRVHTNALRAVVGGAAFSQPAQLRKNIIYRNRSYFWQATAPNLQQNPAGLYQNLGVLGTLGTINNGAAQQNYTNNVAAPNTLFIAPYLNTLTTAAAADEGGNFVQVYYTPLGLTGNYHVPAGSPVVNAGDLQFTTGDLSVDFDGQARPTGSTTNSEIGADER